MSPAQPERYIFHEEIPLFRSGLVTSLQYTIQYRLFDPVLSTLCVQNDNRSQTLSPSGTSAGVLSIIGAQCSRLQGWHLQVQHPAGPHQGQAVADKGRDAQKLGQLLLWDAEIRQGLLGPQGLEPLPDGLEPLPETPELLFVGLCTQQ